MQPYFGQQKIHSHYLDTDSFVLSVNTKEKIRDLKSLEDTIDFSYLDKNHELLSNKNKRRIGKFQVEKPKHIWIDEFVCVRNKMYAFKGGDNSKNKLKGISKSQPKHIKNMKTYILKNIKTN